jgi:hypothetical protein
VKGLICPFWVERAEHAGKHGHLSAHLHLQESIHGITIPMEFHVALERGRFRTIPNETFPGVGGFLVGFDPTILKSHSDAERHETPEAVTNRPWWRRWMEVFRTARPDFKREGPTLRWGMGAFHLTIEDNVPDWALDWLFDGRFTHLPRDPSPQRVADTLDKHFGQLQVLGARHQKTLDKETFVGLARVKGELSYAILNNTSYVDARDTLHEVCKRFTSEA